MAFTYTTRAQKEALKTKVEPQLVLEIDGLSTLYGAIKILRLIRIGDDGLLIGNDWRIGGLTEMGDQFDYLSLEGTGTKIDQQIQPDKGSVSSVSSVQVGIIDKNKQGSKLISPGILVPNDILGTKATLWMGYKNTAFKDDFIPIFSGVIDEVEAGAGLVKLNIAHPEQLKRKEVFNPIEFLLETAINASQTTIPISDASQLPVPLPGPDASFDDTIKFYVKIDDEIIRYTGVSGNNLTGCTRGELATVAASHTPSPDPIAGASLVALYGTPVELALKLMLSGVNGFYREDIPIKRYLHPTPFTTVANSIFFEGIDLTRDYGIVAGDYVTITGAANGANNCSAKQIQSIDTNDAGSYAVISGVSFVEESPSTALMAVRSQYDTLGYGLGLLGDQVDVTEHLFWHAAQLANYTMQFFLDKKIDGKDFLDKEIYLPVGAYSIPRQGRCSMGYHIGPTVRGPLKVLNASNIKDPDKIKLKRSINRNFYNSVVFKFDKLATQDRYVSGTVDVSSESLNRINVGAKTLRIASQGLRRLYDGVATATRVAARYLGRYKMAAEYFEGVGVMFKDGATIEPGDNIIVDFSGLEITNTEDGTRTKPAKTYTVTNRSIDLKTGDVKISITDANFDGSERYGVVSPSSLITGGTTLKVQITDSFGAIFPGDEGKKWDEFAGQKILIHSDDWTTEHEVILQGVNPANRYELLLDPSTPLPSPPVSGWIVDIANYPNNTDPLDQSIAKAAFAFLGPSPLVTSGVSTTSFNVNLSDAAFFQVGGIVRVHNADYSNDSGEVLVQSVLGTLITVASSLGFTPSAGDICDTLPMPDGAESYRLT